MKGTVKRYIVKQKPIHMKEAIKIDRGGIEKYIFVPPTKYIDFIKNIFPHLMRAYQFVCLDYLRNMYKSYYLP